MMPNALMKIITTLLLALCIFGQSVAVESNSITKEKVIKPIHTPKLLKIKSYGVSEGLSQSAVTSLVEDADGFAWIGTLNGLNRFDGDEFKQYFSFKEKNSLPSSFIRSLYFSEKYGLFIGTDKGLTVYNKTDDDFTLINNLLSQQIWNITEHNDQIIVGTENEIIYLNNKLEYVKSIDGDFGGIKKIIFSNNLIYVRNYMGDIIAIDNIEKKVISDNTNDIVDAHGKVIIIKPDGVFEVLGKKVRKINSNHYSNLTALPNKYISIKEQNIYSISTDFSQTSIDRLDIKNIEVTNPHVIRGKKTNYITTHNIGLLVNYDYNNTISTIDIEDKNIWSIAKDLKSNLFIATGSKYINLYSKSNKIVAKYNTEAEGPKQVTTLKDSLFITTTEGLLSIDKYSKNREVLSPGPFFAIHKSQFDEAVYAGTTDGKVIEVSENKQIIMEHSVDIGNPVFDIKKSSTSLWVATQGGLFKIQDGKIENIFNKGIVISISLSTNNEDIYFGTETSLLKFTSKNKKIETIYSNNRPIYSIVTDTDYIYSTSIKELVVTQIVDNKTISLSDTYGSQDEYNAQSILDFNNTIYIGGISGISAMSKVVIDKIFSSSKAPKANINELLVFNIPVNIGSSILKENISSTKKIILKYSDYPFTLKFNSPGNGSEKIDYIYQMQGLSESWIHSEGINSATYTNLSSGEYTFNIYAFDPLTHNQGEIKSLNILITPPWWLSKQAKLVYFIITLIISAVIVQGILRRREVQKKIAKSEERLKLSLWGSGDEMWDWDIETGQIYRSNIWGSLEFPKDGQRSGDADEESNIHPMDQDRVTKALNSHFDGNSDHFEAAYRVKGKSDEWVWILDRAKIVERDEKDNPLRMTGTIKNINNFKNAEEQLRLFERAIANISEGMFILDNNFIFVEVNEACCELSLIPKEQFIGSLFKFNLYPDSYSEQIRSILHQQGSWSNDVESAKGDGTSFLMELTVDAIYDELGQLSHYVGVFSDISRRKLQEEELRKLTNNDLLTNLPNRSSLMVTLGNLVKRDTHHTLMVLDLDNFKKINDSMGHQIGDELLIKVAKRIEAAVPYHTSIYRLGGDEFAILVDNNPDIGSSAVIANNVIDAFASPFELTSEKVVVGLSIGIVLYPEDDQNEQALLRKADIAMYHAKSGGGNRYQFYSESINRNAIRQLEVENLIREGLRDDLFEVYYQPKIALKTGRMAGMEALVRLNHPEHGLIPPSEFIPLAEENGLIVDIGDLVMRKACFATQKWRSLGLFDGRVAVNLSSYQFALPDLQQRIESILRLTQLPAANLELEITEGTVIKQPEKAIKVMQQLSKMGVSLALDDFGTGYSSLSYLKRFPIHTLKIDKAFVDDIDKSDRDLKMVDSIITIAHNMGLSVVGEGVEDASQLSILKALKCEEIQGFLFSKAVTETQFSELLEKNFIEPDIVQKNTKAI
ncbi:diguanylate cyclase/phosphodiesterase with PAS/PAC sensor(s) [Shewanella woodyi ATCC 51908]|uniref:cyclic-guanylate-specific phosphodiesterase n=1 Tax=Shewanella woodyi (strain ATCC 51908 / MS32) TaxID=392500 RepID=B1KKS6_SHEWM|nr:diguanylate cyclase/phosphodiesterase with PAS/PAC sensor(s) [Shewanella woodyi ATCC 51908]